MGTPQLEVNIDSDLVVTDSWKIERNWSLKQALLHNNAEGSRRGVIKMLCKDLFAEHPSIATLIKNMRLSGGDEESEEDGEEEEEADGEAEDPSTPGKAASSDVKATPNSKKNAGKSPGGAFATPPAKRRKGDCEALPSRPGLTQKHLKAVKAMRNSMK